MRVAIYARVSTPATKKKADSNDPQQNPETQLRPLRDAARVRGWEITGEYMDRISGSKDTRPQLDQLTKDANMGKFDVVMVWKLDRWGRSLRHLINSIEELHARGVAFVSLSDNLDFTTPAGRLMFQIMGAFAEFERELIRDRVKAGMARATAQGKDCGRRKKVFRRDQALELRAAGKSLREIAAELGVSHGTIRNVLNEARD